MNGIWLFIVPAHHTWLLEIDSSRPGKCPFGAAPFYHLLELGLVVGHAVIVGLDRLDQCSPAVFTVGEARQGQDCYCNERDEDFYQVSSHGNEV